MSKQKPCSLKSPSKNSIAKKTKKKTHLSKAHSIAPSTHRLPTKKIREKGLRTKVKGF